MILEERYLPLKEADNLFKLVAEELSANIHTQIIICNDILNEFYHDWLNVDTPLGEVLENSIEESISMVTKYYKSKGKER